MGGFGTVILKFSFLNTWKPVRFNRFSYGFAGIALINKSVTTISTLITHNVYSNTALLNRMLLQIPLLGDAIGVFHGIYSWFYENKLKNIVNETVYSSPDASPRKGQYRLIQVGVTFKSSQLNGKGHCRHARRRPALRQCVVSPYRSLTAACSLFYRLYVHRMVRQYLQLPRH